MSGENGVLLAVVFFAFYKIGYFFGWKRGFEEGDEMGTRFGRICGWLDAMDQTNEIKRDFHRRITESKKSKWGKEDDQQ